MKLDIRLYILIGLVVISLWYFISPMISKRTGVVVVSVDEASKCGDIKVGDYITHVGGEFIENKESFEAVIGGVKKGRRVTMVIDWGPGGCNAIEDGIVGLEVIDAPSKRFMFGLDISGGKRVWLDTDAEVAELEDIKKIIEKRAQIFGVPQFKVNIDNGNLFIDVLNVNDVPFLITYGVLEGLIEQRINVFDGVGQIKIGSDYYDFELSIPKEIIEVPLNETSIETTENGTESINETTEASNETEIINETNLEETAQQIKFDFSKASVIIEGGEYFYRENFIIDGISFKLLNITNDSITISALVFENKDISTVPGVSSYIRYESRAMQYQFIVPVEFSDLASERFSKITAGMPSVFVDQTSVLEGLLVFYIDGEEINRLTIPSDMAEERVNSMSIIGFAPNSKEATIKKKIVEMAIAGNINQETSLGEVGEYSSGGIWLLYAIAASAFIAPLIFFILNPAMYKGRKTLKMSIWSSLLFLSTVFTVFGIAAMSQSLFAPGWILDGPSIFGIFALCVWMLIHFILTSEKSLKRRDSKIKKYLDIVLISAGFVLLFTQFIGFGMAMVVGGILIFLIAAPLYKKILSEV